MKSSIKKHLVNAGAYVAVLGILVFVGCFMASVLVWTPGTPSMTAQILTVIGACGLPLSLLGIFLATLD